jgi:hypothetical protein
MSAMRTRKRGELRGNARLRSEIVEAMQGLHKIGVVGDAELEQTRPQPPRNAPEGTVWFGGPIGWFSIALTVRATDLVPDEITRLLLVEPTRAQIKGVPLARRAGARAATFGSWAVALTPRETDEWDVSKAIRLLVGRFPKEIAPWRQLPSGAEVRLSLGLALATANQGFSLPPDILRFAADRDIEIEFDIYADSDFCRPALDKDGGAPPHRKFRDR